MSIIKEEEIIDIVKKYVKLIKDSKEYIEMFEKYKKKYLSSFNSYEKRCSEYRKRTHRKFSRIKKPDFRRCRVKVITTDNELYQRVDKDIKELVGEHTLIGYTHYYIYGQDFAQLLTLYDYVKGFGCSGYYWNEGRINISVVRYEIENSKYFNEINKCFEILYILINHEQTFDNKLIKGILYIIYYYMKRLSSSSNINTKNMNNIKYENSYQQDSQRHIYYDILSWICHKNNIDEEFIINRLEEEYHFKTIDKDKIFKLLDDLNN